MSKRKRFKTCNCADCKYYIETTKGKPIINPHCHGCKHSVIGFYKGKDKWWPKREYLGKI